MSLLTVTFYFVTGGVSEADLHVLDRSQLLRVTLGPHTNARKAAKEQEVTLMADDLPGWPCGMCARAPAVALIAFDE